MKSAITIPCGCGKQVPLEIVGSSLPKSARCFGCGATIYLIEPLGNIPMMLLMERAKHELAHNDITICILLSAVAVEGEMSWLFFKWKVLDSGKLLASQTLADRKQWEDEWTSLRSIGKRLDELSRFLTERPFDEFANLKMKLIKPALTGYDPAGSIKDFFQAQFFEKRNSVVHYGEIDLQEADGKRCFSLASALLALFHAMDAKRFEALEETHRKARESRSLSGPRSVDPAI
jgi:hypothetical protein